MTPDEYRKKHPRCATCKYFVSNYANSYRVFVMLKSNQRKELKADFVKYISLPVLRRIK